MGSDSRRPARLLRAVVALLLVASSAPTLFAAAKKSPPPPPKGAATNSKGEPVSLRGNTEKTVPLRTHSIYAPYVDSDLQNRWFDFGGSTIINTNKHVRLTQDRPSQSGWLWSRLALAPNSFEVEFEFRVDGKSNNLYGDGMAVWLTKARAGMGPAFGSSDYWDGLGIFFDT
jgi:mannose-binding lectin 2